MVIKIEWNLMRGKEKGWYKNQFLLTIPKNIMSDKKHFEVSDNNW